MTIFLIVIGIIILAFGALGIGLMLFVQYPKRPTIEETTKIEKEKGFLENYEEFSHEKLDFVMDDGYRINGIIMMQKVPAKKFVIITHGYSYNRMGSIKYALLFYRLGYNVYFYDLRHFGENEKVYCTMGRKEPVDIVNIARLLREKYGNDISIGLHGESLGAGSSVLALGLDKSFSFCVADCPFSDVSWLFEQLIKLWFKLPAGLSHIGSWMCLVFRGYRFDRIKPINSFDTNDVTPVCFIHGADDDFITPEHSMRMYDKCKAYKEIHIVEGANHAQSFQTDKAAYGQIVADFLHKVDSL